MNPIHALFFLATVPGAEPTGKLEFNRDVRPILSDVCFACHGFDARARKAKLRLDLPEGAFAERRGIVPIKPGDPKSSEVWNRITSTSADVQMPPPDSHKQLTPAQKETIRKWIEQGAKYQKHWSFEPIRRPAIPEARGEGSAIDVFLLDRLRKEGLKPQPEADRETLIRRVSFALTGLPPTVKELDEYLGDRSANAYERMVDFYLASPRFGEEMARHWLDVARYADTHGLHLDNERQMWAYRDWVVRAFNENLPFDKFTIWQLAGDQLSNPTADQLVATGFNRCNVTTGEGGSIDAEWLYRNAVDRTSTAVQAWLGLTAGCAVCHDHKFDPLSTREYYSLYAFFYSSADPPLDGNVNTTGPFVKLPTPAQKAALEAAARAEASARKRLELAAMAADYVDPAEKIPLPERRAITDVLFDDTFPPGAINRNTSRNAADWLADPPFGARSGRRVLRQANSFFHEDVIQFRLRPVVVPGNGAIEAWIRLDPAHPPTALAIQVNGGRKVWWGKESTLDSTPGESGLGMRKGQLPAPAQWVKLNVPVVDLGLKEGQFVTSLTLQEYGGVAFWDAVAIMGDLLPSVDPLASFQVWWKGLGGKLPPELPTELNAVATGGPARKHAPEQVAKLRAFYLTYVARPVSDELAARQHEWEEARANHHAAADAIPGTMVFRDLDVPRNAFVMLRGQYDKPGEKVQPGVPAILPPLQLQAEGGNRSPAEENVLRTSASVFRFAPSPVFPSRVPRRLDLANWTVAPENPLTARVAVNRLWQQFFGIGLVKTSYDFGSQGQPPSHPELLDWLAVEYRESGWDTKKLVRAMVTSSAFRRDSRQTAALQLSDPENRLLARGPRLRLDAEQVRDNALFVSGLMNLKMGGRGVNPYQPPNVWEPIGYGDSNTRYYLQDHGTELYRRSIYVFIKRTAPHPFLTNFDGTNREQLCAVRDRTNTPLQALQLMNDVQQFEAARALAELTLARGGKTAAERVTFLYRTVLARHPEAEEIRLVTAAVEKQRDLFTANPSAAAKVIRVGESKSKKVVTDVELAAWTMIANLILNLDETINRN